MRKKSDTITDENYFDWMALMGKDLIKYIVYSLQDVYSAQYIVREDYNILAGNFLSFCMYYDIKHNLMYLYYKLDEERFSAPVYDRELYNRIFDGARNICKDYDIKLQIIGTPTTKQENSRNRANPKVDQENQVLRPYTTALWYISPKGNPRPYFIENQALAHDEFFRLGNSEEDWLRYVSEVENLNEQFNLPGDEYEDFPAIWESYSRIYNSYYGKDPETFDPNKVINIYVDVEHNPGAEKSYSEIHDRGHFLNPEKISEIILLHKEIN